MYTEIPRRHSLARRLAGGVALGLVPFVLLAAAVVLTFVYLTERADAVSDAHEAGQALLTSVAAMDWIPATEIRDIFEALPVMTEHQGQRLRNFTLVNSQRQVIASTDMARAWAIAAGLRQTTEAVFARDEERLRQFAGEDWLMMPVHGPEGEVRGVLIVQVFSAQTLRVLTGGLALSGALTAGLLLVVSAFGAIGVRNLILRPLAALLAGARAVQAGDLEHRVQISSGDEFQTVAEAFNEMNAALAAQNRENVRLLNEAEQRAAQMNEYALRQSALMQLSTQLVSAFDVDDICRRAAQGLHDTLGYDYLGLFLVDEATGDRVLHASVGWTDAPPNWRIPPGRGLSERALLDGQLHYTPDVAQDPRYVPSLKTGAEVDVPLIVGQKVIGVLVAESSRPHGFDQADFDVLSAAAGQTALAIGNARLLAGERQRADELDALRATLTDISSELEMPKLLHALVERAAALLGAFGGDLALRDQTTGEIVVAASHNMGKEYIGTRLAPGEGAAGRVLETCEPLIIADYAAWEGRSPQYAEAPIHALMNVPLMVGGLVVGAIGVVHSDPVRQFGPSDLRLLSLFGQQAAIAVSNARLYEDVRRRVGQLAALNEIAQIIGSTIEIDTVLEQIGEAVRRTLLADTYLVITVDDSTGAHMLEILYDEGERFPKQELPPGKGASGWVIRNRTPLLLRDLPIEAPAMGIEISMAGKRKHLRSWLGVPMETARHLAGVLAVGSYRPAAFGAEDMELLQNIAQQAALAIEHGRHHAEVEEQARRDSLTQVYNHGYFLKQLQAETVRALDTGCPLALIMLDVDYFKQYNDTYGHVVGDHVLRLTVQAIHAHVKRTDPVGRWGGEEFAIALPGANCAQARQVAERIRATLANLSLHDRDGNPLPLPTVSQGLAVLPDETENMDVLIHLADGRLYQAKERGRDQIESPEGGEAGGEQPA